MNDNEMMDQYKKYEPFFGSWYLKRFIGEGSFAKVFEIVRNDFGNEYISALKIITVSKTRTEIEAMKSEGMSGQEIQESLKEIVEDTVREIQLMYKLRGNGNIVGYEDHAVMEHEDGLGWDICIKMEFLTSLSSFIKSGEGSLSRRDIIKLGADICKALEACQKYNITHRDIKSDNIFISNTGDFKLGDFGIARVIERKDMELSRKGTSAYMAPEVYKGQSYTSAVDIYSLGIVLYRLLNHNRGPFLPEYPAPISLDERDSALMRRMSGEEFPGPAQAREGRLAEIVLKACAYHPEDRYLDPTLMRQELEAILYGETETAGDELIRVTEESEESGSGAGDKKTAAADEYEATEVLREEEDPLSAGVPLMAARAEVKVLCKKCGNAINRDAAFCTICGFNQREEVKSASLWKMGKDRNGKSDSKKQILIAGICVAILLIVGVGIGVAVSGSSSEHNTVETGKSEVSSGTGENAVSGTTPEQTGSEGNTVHNSADWRGNVLRADALENGSGQGNDHTVLGSHINRQDISSITILDSLETMPDNAWDVSADNSGKVMAWTIAGNEGYELYIGAEGGIEANANCSGLFAYYVNVTEININGNLHTENTTDMSMMFAGCEKLASLNLNGYDTSNVTTVRGMFYGINPLINIEAGDFDTSNVTDADLIFSP
ncbi:MAG: protein kinase [Lachnospiraceae bacterium]|nr:protein kinase [Lachnospiraceae bacterium]